MRTPATTLSARTYRWTDRLTKLGGLALVAAGLDAGGATTAGVALGVLGTALALATVFVTRANSGGREDGESNGERPGERATTDATTRTAGDDESNRAATTDDLDTDAENHD